jgi:virulence factor Mce-like protein
MRRGGSTRRREARWLPALGTAIVLVVAAIVYVAYTANRGLPFQSRYDVYVDVPNADRLISTADVRIGGVLVGEVLSVTAEHARARQPPYARIELALSHAVGRLPIDTTAQVRPESVLGLTYVDLHLGRSGRTIKPGGTLPISRALPSSDLTDLFDIFKGNASSSFRSALTGLAGGFAGRGSSLNLTIGSTSRLFVPLQAVSATLASPQADLSGFLSSYERTIGAVDPVATPLTGLVSNAATTFAALAGVRAKLGEATDLAPEAEAATTRAFIRVRPALDGLAKLAVELRPTGTLLPGTLAKLNPTLADGVLPLRELPGFSRPLGTALDELETFARDPNTTNSLRKLSDLIPPTTTVVSAFAAAQLNCDAVALYGINGSSAFGSLGDGEGPALTNVVLGTGGALGEELQNARPSPNVAINPLPHETADDCESGNETFSGHQQLLNLPNFHSTAGRSTTPPPGVLALARSAGLLKPIPGLN